MAIFIAVYGYVCPAFGGFMVELSELGCVPGGCGVDWVFDLEGLS